MTQQTTTAPPQEAKIKTEGNALVLRAKELKVATAEQFREAAEFKRIIREYRKRVSDFMDPRIDAANKLHKSLTRGKKELDLPAAEAEKIVDAELGRYNADEERKAKEEQARLQAQAKKDQEDAALRQAQSVSEAGDQATADRILDQATEAGTVPAVSVAPATPKVEGLYFVEEYGFVIKDPALVPMEYRTIDEKKIGGVVRATKGTVKIPGVEVTVTKKPRQRTVAAKDQPQEDGL